MQTYHEVRDADHLEALTDSIRANGWIGAPLVRFGDDQLITGSHRYPAALAAGLYGTQIPMIDLEAVFEEDGVDFAEMWAEYGEPAVYDGMFVSVLQQLSDDICDKYGIDIF